MSIQTVLKLRSLLLLVATSPQPTVVTVWITKYQALIQSSVRSEQTCEQNRISLLAQHVSRELISVAQAQYLLSSVCRMWSNSPCRKQKNQFEQFAAHSSISFTMQLGVKPTMIQTRVLLIKMKNENDFSAFRYFFSKSWSIESSDQKSIVIVLLTIFNHALNILIYFGNFRILNYVVLSSLSNILN